MKFINKNTGVVIETKNNYEDSILKSNPNYTEFVKNDTKCIKNEENRAENEIKSQKTTKKGGKKATL